MGTDFSVQKSTVLLVDDEPINIELLSEILITSGYSNIHSISDSRRVKTFCENNDVDLILLDFRMPYMDGIEVMRQLRKSKNQYEIPIVILTAETNTDIHQIMLRDGAKDVLIKPFNHINLLCRIQTILNIHLFQKYTRIEA